MQSKWLLLQTASPAALIRLRSSSSLRSEVQGLNDIYFHHQYHSSLREFLSHKLIESAPTEGLLIQVWFVLLVYYHSDQVALYQTIGHY